MLVNITPMFRQRFEKVMNGDRKFDTSLTFQNSLKSASCSFTKGNFNGTGIDEFFIYKTPNILNRFIDQ